jgi:hypothetical protein
MNRRAFISAATASIFCATRYGFSHSLPPADSEEDSYAIYSLLLTSSKREVYDQSKLWLIGETTLAPDPPKLLTHDDPPLPPILRAMNALNKSSQPLDMQPPTELLSDAQQAIEDYKENRTAPLRLERRFRLPKKYLILSSLEQQQYFDLHPPVITSDWHPDPTAYLRFRNADGIDSFSRIGFNRDRTFAMAFLETNGGGCGVSSWKTFVKTNSRWTKLKCESTGIALCS